MDRELIIHPGEILLEEFIQPHGMTASGLAERLDLPANRITAIVNGTRGITAQTAVLLGTAFGTSTEFWTNLQARYELDRARANGDISPERLAKAEALHRDLAA